MKRLLSAIALSAATLTPNPAQAGVTNWDNEEGATCWTDKTIVQIYEKFYQLPIRICDRAGNYISIRIDASDLTKDPMAVKKAFIPNNTRRVVIYTLGGGQYDVTSRWENLDDPNGKSIVDY